MTSEDVFDELHKHGGTVKGKLTARTGNRGETPIPVVLVTLNDGRTLTGEKTNGTWVFS